MICDKLGQEIKPGCVIAYGHALARSAALRIGRVVRVKSTPAPVYRAALGDDVRITVHGVDDGWSWEPKPKLTKKKGTLLFPDRTIVLDPSRVPASFMDLLNTVEVEQ